MPTRNSTKIRVNYQYYLDSNFVLVMGYTVQFNKERKQVLLKMVELHRNINKNNYDYYIFFLFSA